MFQRTVSIGNIHILLKRSFHESTKVFSENNGKSILSRVFGSNKYPAYNCRSLSGESKSDIPTHADVLIVGGGGMGSSTAYWLKEKSAKQALSVVILEKDLTYSQCSTCLSNGGLRQQFSLPENIQMSLFGAEFMSNIKQRFGPDADVNFTPNGYVMLATEEGAEQLIDNSKIQNELGAVNVMLQKHQIKERFPWMNVDDLAVGCLGLEKEGWFDPWSLLQLYRKGATEKGCHYVNAKAVEFKFEGRAIEGVNKANYEHPTEVVIETPEGEKRSITFSRCVIAAGPQSGKVAELLKIGTGDGALSVPVPVEPRKRYVYRFASQGDSSPGLKTPMVIDHTGAYFRKDGLAGDFIGGISPRPEDEPDPSNLDVDHDWFDQKVWPLLAHRVPAFNAVKVKSGWGGYYEFNRVDENGIIGKHPSYTNVYIATGFSGHGIQQSPAVGRAIAELILDGSFQTIDLTRMGFERLLLNKPLKEARII